MKSADTIAVLIVEDSPETAELERRVLRRTGFAPHITHSVDQAKAQLAVGGYAAVLLDYRLPDGSAWDVVSVAHAADPPVPVVLVTAMGSENVAAEAIRRGIALYIRKSDTFWDDLPSAMRQVIDHARVQEELRHNSALFRVIADNANDIIVLLDADETILYASAAVRRILGYAPAELRGRKLQALLCPGEPAARVSATSANAMPRHALRFSAKDGQDVLLEPTFRPAQDPDAARMIGVLRDVTEQVRLEEQLRHQQRMETIGQLTAGMAHDFNNLLQAMMGSLEILLDEVTDQPELRECAQGALRMGERGARLIHHLLAFARKQVLKPRSLELPDLVKDVAHTLRRTLGPQITTEIDVAPNCPRVYADPGQLEAALLNLGLNARDAMPRGGTLAIRTTEVGPLVLNPLEDTPARRFVVLAVTDTGAGMSPETLANACEPFFTTKGPQGSGLGLSMVHGFARQSGGDIGFESAPGEGTRVEIWLPVAEQAPEPIAPVAPAAARCAGRVLLVDDEPEVRLTLGSFLKSAGFGVRSACDGDEALALLATGEPVDVLVTDYAMPGLDGLELLAQVRRVVADLPVLVVSGYSEAERLESQAPHVRVLPKPFRRQALVREVAALVEARARSGAVRAGAEP